MFDHTGPVADKRRCAGNVAVYRVVFNENRKRIAARYQQQPVKSLIWIVGTTTYSGRRVFGESSNVNLEGTSIPSTWSPTPRGWASASGLGVLQEGP